MLSGTNNALFGVGGGGEIITGAFSNQPYLFYTNSIERMRIDASGNVGIGTTAPAAALDVGGASFIRNTRYGADSAYVQRRANGTISSPTASLIGETQIVRFDYYDGASFIPAAQISAAVDGTPGTNDMPGRIVFSTTADGAATPTERMRIDSAGNVGIGTPSPGGRLEVTGAGSSIVDARLRVNNPNTSSNSTAILDLYSNSRTRAEIYGQQDGTGNGGFLILNTSDTAGALQERMRLTSDGNLGVRTSTQFGSGVGVIGVANATTVPTTNPTGGGVLYVEGGALKYRGSSGTVTTIANA
jgi:hypothetical protein